MYKKQSISITPKTLHLLQALKSTRTGSAIYEHVQDMLEDFETSAQQTQQAYLDLIQLLLEEFAKQLPADSPLLIHLKLIKMRLALPLSLSEIHAIGEQLRSLSRKLSEGIELSPDSLKEIWQEETVEETAAGSQPPTGVPATPVLKKAAEATTAPSEEADEHAAPEASNQVELADGQCLEDKRKRIHKIQETLTTHLADVIKQNEKFGILLEVEQESLRQTDNIDEIGSLKETLIKEVAKLMEGHQELTRKLESANKYLHIIESEGQYLNDELTRVHILSLTDELTELPNRRAFMRRLEDEVARVQRYGYPLSLAFLDMDRFKEINDTYGHAAGDEVLRNFANNILTIFRHHDMVARYGGEEFAVILPNTDQHGTLRALQKVQKKTVESPYHYNDETRSMPTFSAGIALYRPGETPGSLIERADKALYQAKRLGRNRIELANNDHIEASAR